MTTEQERTSYPKDALKLTKQDFPPPNENSGNLSILTAILANVGDRIIPWGLDYVSRDDQLRKFWPTESYLASAIYAVSIGNASFEWEVEGPDRLSHALTDMLNGSMAGQDFGWIPFINAISQDLYTQDNGLFIEIIRDPGKDAASKFKNEKAPVIGLAHLDAARCVRTGNPLTPVIYKSRNGKRHKLKWYQVIARAEYPSAIEHMYGVGYSAVTRILKVSQVMQSILTYKDEKIGGRQFQAMHFVSGPAKKEVDDAIEKDMEKADNEGLIRFMKPSVIVSLDPEKPVSTATIEFASLPDGFNFDEDMKWYISALALGLGRDYQDLAPLPSGNIGSASQSEILHRKSIGKGKANFMENMQNWFRDYGIIPRPAEFKFKVKDLAEDMEKAAMQKEMLESVAIARRQNIIDGDTARLILSNQGVFAEADLDNVPDGYGNEEVGNSEQLLGTAGGTTLEEDSKRVEKNLLDRVLGRK